MVRVSPNGPGLQRLKLARATWVFGRRRSATGLPLCCDFQELSHDVDLRLMVTSARWLAGGSSRWRQCMDLDLNGSNDLNGLKVSMGVAARADGPSVVDKDSPSIPSMLTAKSTHQDTAKLSLVALTVH